MAITHVITHGLFYGIIMTGYLFLLMITPRFVIIPGSVDEDYKDFSHHYRGHAKAVIPMILLGLLIAGVVSLS